MSTIFDDAPDAPAAATIFDDAPDIGPSFAGQTPGITKGAKTSMGPGAPATKPTIQEIEAMVDPELSKPAFVTPNIGVRTKAPEPIKTVLEQAVESQPMPPVVMKRPEPPMPRSSVLTDQRVMGPEVETPERGYTRAFADTGLGLYMGGVNVVKGITDNLPGNPISDYLETVLQGGQRLQSPDLRAQQVRMQGRVGAAQRDLGELGAARVAFQSAFDNPAAGMDVAAQGIGSVIPTTLGAAAGLGVRGMAALSALSNAGSAAQQAAEQLRGMPVQYWAADPEYQQLMSQGWSHADAVATIAAQRAIPSQIVGGLAGLISGSHGFERTLAGERVVNRLGQVRRGAAELGGELLEEGAPLLAGNVTQMSMDPTQKLTEGLGDTLAQTLLGAAGPSAYAGARAPIQRQGAPNASQPNQPDGTGGAAVPPPAGAAPVDRLAVALPPGDAGSDGNPPGVVAAPGAAPAGNAAAPGPGDEHVLPPDEQRLQPVHPTGTGPGASGEPGPAPEPVGPPPELVGPQPYDGTIFAAAPPAAPAAAPAAPAEPVAAAQPAVAPAAPAAAPTGPADEQTMLTSQQATAGPTNNFLGEEGWKADVHQLTPALMHNAVLAAHKAGNISSLLTAKGDLKYVFNQYWSEQQKQDFLKQQGITDIKDYGQQWNAGNIPVIQAPAPAPAEQHPLEANQAATASHGNMWMGNEAFAASGKDVPLSVYEKAMQQAAQHGAADTLTNLKEGANGAFNYNPAEGAAFLQSKGFNTKEDWLDSFKVNPQRATSQPQQTQQPQGGPNATAAIAPAPAPATTSATTPAAAPAPAVAAPKAKQPTQLQKHKAELLSATDPDLMQALGTITKLAKNVTGLHLVKALDYADANQRSDIAKAVRKRLAALIDKTPDGPGKTAMQARLAKPDPFGGKVIKTHGPQQSAATYTPGQSTPAASGGWQVKSTHLPPAVGKANFLKWFGKSVLRNGDGSPRKWVHRSKNGKLVDILVKGGGQYAKTNDAQGKKESAFFASPDTGFSWSGTTNYVYLRSEKPFDFDNPADRAAVAKQATTVGPNVTTVNGQPAVNIQGTVRTAPEIETLLKSGSWGFIESPTIMYALKALNYDATYVKEQGKKNIAVFNVNQVKSAESNTGEYSDTGVESSKPYQDKPTMEDRGAQVPEDFETLDEDDTDGEDLVEELMDAGEQGREAGGEVPSGDMSEPDFGESMHDANNPTARQVSSTSRASNFYDIWHAAGIDPTKGRQMTFGKQFAILAKQFKDRFGVPVILGKAARKWETISQMQDAYRNGGWLMSIMGLPPKAMSLGGKLKLNLEKKKPGGYLGQFNAANWQLDMPGRSNSFAHEWGHALDAWFIDFLGVKSVLKTHWLSRGIATKGLDVSALPLDKQPLAGAYVRLMQAIFKDNAELAARITALEAQASAMTADGKPTPEAAKAQALLKAIQSGKPGADPSVASSEFFKNAQALDAGSKKKYFSDPAELIARTFESFAGFMSERAHALATADGLIEKDDAFITKGDRAYLSDGDEYLRQAFPKAEDRLAIFAAWSEVMNELASQQALGDLSDVQVPGESVMQAQPQLDEQMPETALLKRLWQREIGPLKAKMRKEAAQLEATGEVPQGWYKRLDAMLGQWGDTATTLGLLGLGSQRGVLNFIQARTGSKALARLNRKLFRDLNRVGQRDQATETMSQQIEMRNIPMLNKLDDKINQLFGKGYQFTLADNSYLRHLMTSQEESTYADVHELVAAAPHQGMDEAHAKKLADLALYMRDKNIVAQLEYMQDPKRNVPVKEIGYGYLTRRLDIKAIEKNPEKFQERAGRAYGVIFDEDVGTDADSFKFTGMMDAVRRLGFTWKATYNHETGKKVPRTDGRVSQRAAKLVKQVNQQYKQMRALKAEKAAAQKAGEDIDPVLGKINRLQAEIDETVEEMLPLLRADYSKALAEDWHTRIMIGGRNPTGLTGPSASFVQHRALPMEADTYLAPFYGNDVVGDVRDYIERTTRRAVFAEHLGDNPDEPGSKFAAMLRQMKNEGLSHRELGLVSLMVQNVTGRNPSTMPLLLQDAANVARMVGTFTMLPRSTLASLPETVNAARNTGNLVDVVRPLGVIMKSLFKRGYYTELRGFARELGVIMHPFADQGITMRDEGDNFSARQSKWYTQFFERSLLSPLTRLQRTVLTPGYNIYLNKLLARLDDKESRAMLAQWGIPNNRQQQVAEWIKQFDGRLPDPEKDLIDPNTGVLWDASSPAGLYARAMQQLITHTITEPDPIDRPIMASNPAAAMAYQLTGFNYGFWNKIYKPMLRDLSMNLRTLIEGSQANDLDRGRIAALIRGLPVIAAHVASLYAATFVFSTLRDLMFNADRWEEEDKKGTLMPWLINNAIQRTGWAGPMDPVVQAYLGVKYQRDLATLLAGPYLGNMLQNVQDALRGSIQDKAEGPAARNKAAVAWYRLTVGNLLGLVQGMAPGGPALGLAYGVLNAYLGTNMMAQRAAAAAGAPKPPKRGTSTAKTTMQEQPDGTLKAVPAVPTRAKTVMVERNGQLVAVPKPKGKTPPMVERNGRLVPAY